MTIAYWCVLFAALLPYVFTGIAKFSGGRYNNYTPRDSLEKLDGFRKRAHWAQLNGFEAFPLFAAGVIIAHLTAVDQSLINNLAIAFILFRVVHGVMYLLNQPLFRTLTWVAGLSCAVSLYICAA